MFAYFGLIGRHETIRMATVKSGSDGGGGYLANFRGNWTHSANDRLTRERDLGDLAPLRLAVGVLGQLR